MIKKELSESFTNPDLILLGVILFRNLHKIWKIPPWARLLWDLGVRSAASKWGKFRQKSPGLLTDAANAPNFPRNLNLRNAPPKLIQVNFMRKFEAFERGNSPSSFIDFCCLRPFASSTVITRKISPEFFKAIMMTWAKAWQIVRMCYTFWRLPWLMPRAALNRQSRQKALSKTHHRRFNVSKETKNIKEEDIMHCTEK